MKQNKLITTIISGGSDANIAFDDLCGLLRRLGFVERTKGSHHIFRKDDVMEKINLQKDGGNAKPYQVKQVRNILIKYQLSEARNA